MRPKATLQEARARQAARTRQAARNTAGSSNAGGSGGAASGGAGSGAAGAAGSAPLPPLEITSDTASIEFTPLLVAAESFDSGTASVGSGGIVSLLSDSTIDLGSNAETQSLRQSVDHPNLRIIFTVTETFYRRLRACAGAHKQFRDQPDLAKPRVTKAVNMDAALLDKVWPTNNGSAPWSPTSSTSWSRPRPAALHARARSSRSSWTTAF
ncbi:MAG TPA: hypothetical protein VFK05_20790 [Polyangiaceae bacterium]|nr:hypothetical protein [Polyangiaceae bacterium]